MTKGELAAIHKLIATTVKETVNGKIDTLQRCINEHNIAHEADMKRIVPVLEAYESAERRLEDARVSGAFIMKLIGVILAVGSLWLMARQLW